MKNKFLTNGRLAAFLTGFLLSSVFFFSDWISVQIGEFPTQIARILFPGYEGFTPVAFSVFLIILPVMVAIDYLILSNVKKSSKHFVGLLTANIFGFFLSMTSYLLLFSVAAAMFTGF